jgi:protein-ribulosamine 3-kinase
VEDGCLDESMPHPGRAAGHCAGIFCEDERVNRSTDWHDLAQAISATTGHKLASAPDEAVLGGSVSACLRWLSDAGPMFIKVAGADRAWALDAEADGLRALASASAIRVPRVLGAGLASNRAWLALEWIGLVSPAPRSEARLGELLAGQHRATSASFGWHCTNTIGLTEQMNEPDADWARFYAARRLGFQLDIVEASGGGRLLDRGRRLCERVPALLGGHTPVPALLHGDLWAGNHAEDSAGNPVIFDPAVYFGDREADIAMTRLFGGYGRAFYSAYEAAWPLEAGAAERVPLYNLYHVLNHFNLFGGGYRRQAEDMIERLLAEVE